MDRSFLDFQAKKSVWVLLLLIVAVSTKECDRFSQCKGPIRYYEDLKCNPVYEKPNDCCATSYNCSHLNNRSLDKCYANGHEYSIGEVLRDEDRTQPCNIECKCEKLTNNEPGFTCAVAYCPYGEIEKGCNLDFSSKQCCGIKLCSNNDENEFHCKVDGKIFKIGQEFYPEKDPDLVCHCLTGYEGQNVAPYCSKSRCGTEMYDSAKVLSYCVPVFPADLEPQSTCRWFTYRCQNENDTVIGHSENDKIKNQIVSEASGKMCKFGNMLMNIGDELNQDTDLSSICIKCVCEVPPTPTCQRLPDSLCSSERYNSIYNFIKKARPDRNYF